MPYYGFILALFLPLMSMPKRSLLFAACIAAASGFSACNSSGTNNGSTNGESQPTSAGQSTSRGEELFQQRCQACHGVNGNLRVNNAADLQHSVLDSISIAATIKNGRNAMPSFGPTISDADLGQLAMYVKSLRK